MEAPENTDRQTLLSHVFLPCESRGNLATKKVIAENVRVLSQEPLVMKLHVVISRKTVLFTQTAVRNSNVTRS